LYGTAKRDAIRWPILSLVLAPKLLGRGPSGDSCAVSTVDKDVEAVSRGVDCTYCAITHVLFQSRCKLVRVQYPGVVALCHMTGHHPALPLPQLGGYMHSVPYYV
jgi:hypothetical protein